METLGKNELKQQALISCNFGCEEQQLIARNASSFNFGNMYSVKLSKIGIFITKYKIQEYLIILMIISEKMTGDN